VIEPIVKNAADPGQVKHAGRKEKDRRTRERDDLNAVLAIPQGRRFLWRLLAQCGYGENPTHARGDMTHQNIGKADIARFVISEIGEAGGVEPWLLMQREAWRDKQNEHVEAEAVRTASATQSTDAHS
jgi:hypothetical protein